MVEADVRALVREARHGDRRAFEALIDEYQGPIFNLTLRMLNDREDARDATQSAFLKAYQNLESFDERYRFFSWIYRIAVNESLNALNRRRAVGPLDPDTVSDLPGPAEDLSADRVTRAIDSALLQLSAEYRVVIVLRHFLDLSHSEMSEVLGVPEKTVKSRLFTARQRLGALLAKEGITRP
jgi:RNA polymerase sigma-70 factor, ECF subfamily